MTTRSARAAIHWLRLPARSRKARAAGFSGTMPQPTSLATNTAGPLISGSVSAKCLHSRSASRCRSIMFASHSVRQSTNTARSGRVARESAATSSTGSSIVVQRSPPGAMRGDARRHFGVAGLGRGEIDAGAAALFDVVVDLSFGVGTFARTRPAEDQRHRRDGTVASACGNWWVHWASFSSLRGLQCRGHEEVSWLGLDGPDAFPAPVGSGRQWLRSGPRRSQLRGQRRIGEPPWLLSPRPLHRLPSSRAGRHSITIANRRATSLASSPRRCASRRRDGRRRYSRCG